MNETEIDVHATKRLIDEQTIVLVDCREQDEYDFARIDGSILMPMSQWADVGPRLNELNGQHLVVYCHHGRRSLQVTHWLRENGFPNAQSMSGGIQAWSEEIDNNVPQY